MAARVFGDVTRVRMSKHRNTLCSLHIARRDLVPERKFDVAFWALHDPTLV